MEFWLVHLNVSEIIVGSKTSRRLKSNLGLACLAVLKGT